MEGILVVDKPIRLTSHDVVDRVRRKFKMRRVGHAGTLDPLATGILIVLVGQSTKLFGRFVNMDKAYEAVLRLGMTTDSADINGKVTRTASYAHVGREQIEKIFKDMTGEIEQVPPMYSAVKIQGQRLYKLARKGIEVKRAPRRVRIHSLRVLDFVPPDVRFILECSKGTYVRKIAEDAGEMCGCGGCIVQIKRTRVGPYTLKDAVSLDNVNESHLRQFSH